MAEHHEGFLTSSDALSIYHQSWVPDGDPRGVVAVVHGLGEHSGRYRHVAEALVAAGFAVHALDHRGHGRSGGKRTYVKSYDEFMRDLDLFRLHIESIHPGLPLVLLGHSMGGNLAVGYALDHPEPFVGLVLSGPALIVGDDFSGAQMKIFRVLGRVLPGVRPQALDANLISRDPDVVAEYLADPLNYTGKISAGLGLALFDAMDRFPDRYDEFDLPVLLLHGTEDGLADIEGSKQFEAGAVNAAVTSHYYDGLYHEVFNEPERDQVIGDLVAWLESVLP